VIVGTQAIAPPRLQAMWEKHVREHLALLDENRARYGPGLGCP
jgi:hypothetical protein